MSNIQALKIKDGDLMDRSSIWRVDATTYADSLGRLLTDSGKRRQLKGWGRFSTGSVRLLVDEFGNDAYYIV